MKRAMLVCAMVSVFLVSSGTVFAQQAPGAQPGAAQGKMPQISESQLVTRTATVEAIDPAKRMVTLKGTEGRVFDVKVGPEVKNFNQIRVGDKVTAQYYESIAINVRRPGEAPGPGVTEREAASTAKPGERPAGVVADQVTVTTTVEAIAPDKSSVTLKGPRGRSKEVKVRDPKNLENVKVGDKVMITYTEALAVSVEKGRA